MNMQVNGSAGVSPVSVAGMDLETALLAVQSQRASLLEDLLKDQIAAVQAKNAKISRLNELMGLLNSCAAKMSSDAKAGDRVPIDNATLAQLKTAVAEAGVADAPDFGQHWNATIGGKKFDLDQFSKQEIDNICKTFGIKTTVDMGFIGIPYVAPDLATFEKKLAGMNPKVQSEAGLQLLDKIKTLSKSKDKFTFTREMLEMSTKSKGINKGQLDGFIQKMKSNIDSLSNSQQMDMLRLQSLSNKRNEAFDLMTNFVKKMQDNRNTIIGNMR